VNPFQEYKLRLTRRHLLGRTAVGIGAAALASLLNPKLLSGSDVVQSAGESRAPHSPPKAKRVIYLFMSGGPSQIDLFDYKPSLVRRHGEELPGSVRMGQRITGMTAGQSAFPCVSSMFQFKQHGQSGTWVSELLPQIASVVDEITIIKSMNTEAINHDPATTYIVTGHQLPGRPSLGAWLSYGLGSENQNLPAFVVMVSLGSGNPNDQPLFSRLWGSGFLPTQHQGVRFRSGKDPVLYLSNPSGIDGTTRRNMLDAVAGINRVLRETTCDPEIDTRVAQYEMAFRMQTSVPELADISDEPKHILEMYGIDGKERDGGFARNCLLARRMAERGVRFIQLMHRGWDQHVNLPAQLMGQCRDADRPCAALINDLKQRGMLDDTLVVWGGEFGRTVYCQGTFSKDYYGRDHHGRCFTMWLAGGGIKPGSSYGETDDYSYNVVKDPVHIHDLNATILHCLGIEHERLTYRFQGRDYRLTDVHGKLVQPILA
jgi:Protein of unknown function (DUF1501)